MALSDKEFWDLMETVPKNLNIYKYLMVTRAKLRQYKRIAVSYSGGSDSDTILDLIELVKPEDCGEIKYVFYDTGLEWDATHRHISDMEAKYGVNIDRRKPRLSIPATCKKYGVPVFSKRMSQNLHSLQYNGFDFNLEGKGVEHLSAGKEWILEKGGQYGITPEMKLFLSENPPQFPISDMCCDYAKKLPSKDFQKEWQYDLGVQGVRKMEGGPRSFIYKSCFSQTSNGVSEYRPLFFWTDRDKRIYKEWRNLRYSDCYEKWGFTRTGCVGCPCSVSALEALRRAEQYEPNKVKAARAVFGAAHEYREQFNQFKATDKNQLTLEI